MTPITKAARQARIAAILAREPVRSQEELAELLDKYASVQVTQATLSRDLDELGVVKTRAPGGHLVYAMPDGPDGPGLGDVVSADAPAGNAPANGEALPSRLARYLGELLISADATSTTRGCPPSSARWPAMTPSW
jgi:transcriptional regulator of arginine metabolism